MCGIIGYVGKNNNIQETLIDSLKNLEYRGYDSAGLAFVDKRVNVIKSKGRIAKLERKLDKKKRGNIGIAHTRWATHGKASDINSHPHHVGKVTIVHNGIIENYMELKKLLIKEGYNFITDTDTEVACALLDYLKSKNLWSNLEVIKEFASYIRGSYALGIIFDDELNVLYATRKDSPLIVGIGDDENLIASDVAAILKFTNKYCLLEDYEIAQLTKENVKFYTRDMKNICKEKLMVNWNVEQVKKNGYDSFMLKEIYDEPKVLRDTINEYVENLDLFIDKMPDLSKYDKIHIVACGSAMHAGLIGKKLFEEKANIETTVEVASEYLYKKNFYDKKTLVILISQSGETADTIASLRKVKENGIDTLAIVNVVDSTIAREADQVLYIRAGMEVAVATTKAYLLQVAILILISLKLMIERGKISSDELKKLLKVLKDSPEYVKRVLEEKEKYFKVAKKIYKDDNVFFIGRGIDYAIIMEGSLKLKEVSYIHSEAYQAGELKHGTISLIKNHTKVIALITEEQLSLKTISNAKEIKSRGADLILITTKGLDYDYDFITEKIILPDVDSFLVPLIATIPMQLIAYKVAKLRGCDIDKPRNLAKSVTVE